MENALAYTSSLLAVATFAEWMRRAFAVTVPEDRRPFLVAMAAAVVLGAAALALGAESVAAAAAWTGALTGATYLGLAAISGQDRKQPAVAVGSAVLGFTATDDAGNDFDLAALDGRAFLLKFFRGHW